MGCQTQKHMDTRTRGHKHEAAAPINNNYGPTNHPTLTATSYYTLWANCLSDLPDSTDRLVCGTDILISMFAFHLSHFSVTFLFVLHSFLRSRLVWSFHARNDHECMRTFNLGTSFFLYLWLYTVPDSMY